MCEKHRYPGRGSARRGLRCLQARIRRYPGHVYFCRERRAWHVGSNGASRAGGR